MDNPAKERTRLYLGLHPDSRMKEIFEDINFRREDILRALQELEKSGEITSHKAPPSGRRGQPQVLYKLAGTETATAESITSVVPSKDDLDFKLDDDILKAWVRKEIESRGRRSSHRYQNRVIIRPWNGSHVRLPATSAAQSRLTQGMKDAFEKGYDVNIKRKAQRTYSVSMALCSQVLHIALAKLLVVNLRFTEKRISKKKYLEEFQSICAVFFRSHLAEELATYAKERIGIEEGIYQGNT